MRIFLGQLRHVNVKCTIITQAFYQIDKTFRGQCTTIREYTRHFLHVRDREFGLLTDDGTNIHDPLIAEP